MLKVGNTMNKYKIGFMTEGEKLVYIIACGVNSDDAATSARSIVEDANARYWSAELLESDVPHKYEPEFEVFSCAVKSPYDDKYLPDYDPVDFMQ
jgi:hypothetical protein